MDTRLVHCLALVVALWSAVPSQKPAAVREIVLPTERASNVFFVRTTINGDGPFWFTVDTGATLTVLDPSTAARLNLPTRSAGRRSVGVTASDTEMATTTGATLEIDGLVPFSPPLMYVISVQGNAGALGHQIDGVLGTDVLRRYQVTFDYAAGRVSVRPGVPAAGPIQPASIPVTLTGNMLVAPATITLPDRSSLAARLLLDTGSNGAVTLTTPFVRRHTLPERFQTRELTATVGISGVAFSPVVVLPSVAFGDATMPDVRAALSTATSGLAASTDFDGIIGAASLRRFVVTVDYPGRRLILDAPASAR